MTNEEAYEALHHALVVALWDWEPGSPNAMTGTAFDVATNVLEFLDDDPRVLIDYVETLGS